MWLIFVTDQDWRNLCGSLIKGLVKGRKEGFPRGSVVKDLPANAGDTGSIPDPGRPHSGRAAKLSHGGTRHNYRAHELQLLGLWAPEPVLRNKRSQHNEKSAHPNQRAATAFRN